MSLESEKTVSLIKRKTNFDNLTPEKLAEIMFDLNTDETYLCEYCNNFSNTCLADKPNCIKGIIEYLNSETEG